MGEVHLKSKTFWGFFVSYALLMAVLLSVGIAGAWRNALQDARAKTDAVNAGVAAELSEQLNAQVLEVSRLARTLNQMPWVHKLYPETANFDSEYTLKRRMEITREFSLYTGVNAVVERMTLIYPYRDTCISSYVWTDIRTYLKMIGISGGEQDSVLEAICNTSTLSELAAMETAVPGSELVLCAPVEQITRSRAYVCYFISKNKLEESLRRQMPDNMASFTLRGGDLSEMIRVDGYAGGEPAVVIPMKSPFLDWTFEFAFDGSLLGFDRAAVFNNIAADYSWLFLAGFALSYLLSLITYRPIGILLRKVRPAEAAARRARGDYRLIGDCIDRLSADNDRMRAYTGEYDKMMRVNVVRRLIQGYFDEDEAKVQLLRYGIPFCDGDFFQVYLLAGTPGSRSTVETLMKMESLVGNATGGRYTVGDTLDSEMVLIAAFTDGEEAARKNAALLDGIHGDIALGTGSAVFSGTIHRGIIGISLSYQYARDKYMHLYQFDASMYYYPLEWEGQFITALHARNLPTALHILSEIRRENERGLGAGEASAEKIIRLTARILDTLCRVAGEMERGGMPLGNELGMLYVDSNADESWLYIERICRLICSETALPAENDSSALAEELAEYVNAHLSDQNLSLNMMEARFKISLQTINRLFKQHTGCTFYAYVTRQRMEMAKQLLLSSDAPTMSIAEKVGYINEFSFRRAFMRCTGVRPREYSNNNRSPEDRGDRSAGKAAKP